MANVTVRELVINGVTMPLPALEGVTLTTEKIWSANTGRSASGKMLGEVIAQKTTLKLRWPVLTLEEAETIERAVSGGESPFVPVQYTDMGGNTVTKTVYFGTPTYTLYSWAQGLCLVKDAAVDGIEQ